MKKLLFITLFLLLPAIAAAQSPAWAAYNPGNPATLYNPGAQPNAFLAPTANSGGAVTYTPLEPLSPTAASGYGAQPLSTYLSQAYTILITVCSIIAVIMLVVGGIRYMLSEAFTDIGKAKSQMWSAMWGLIIIIGSFLILYSINPNILTFNLNLPAVNQNASNFSPISSGLPTNPPADSQLNQLAPNTVSSTATGDQLNQVAEALHLQHYLASDKYVLYDPSSLSTDQLNAVINGYKDFCEKSGVVATLSGGAFHYTMQKAPGSIFGDSNKTALVCTDN